MRQAVGTVTLFRIVLAFTFIFAGFLAVAITYNRAYRVNNESLNIIQKYESPQLFIDKVNKYLSNSSYSEKGFCESGEVGINIDSTAVNKDLSKKYNYCLSYKCVSGTCNTGTKIRYNMKLFFKFNLPLLGDFATFKIKGQTKNIKYYTNKQVFR